ncbi:hypothetical protein CRYUN_Cryun13aG0093600 [Craigia yunnanensis]
MRTLGSIRHRNILRMAGYGIRDGYGLIVTEFMFMLGGTLFDVPQQSQPRLVLNREWDTQYRIAFGIAHGLANFTMIACHRLSVETSNQ